MRIRTLSIISAILFMLLSACGGNEGNGVKKGKKLYDFSSSTSANYYNPLFVIAGETGTLLGKSFKGLPVTHKSHTPEVCTISGNTLSFIEFTSDVYNKTKKCKFTTHSDGTKAINAFTTPKRVIVVRPKCITNERYTYKGICVSSLASITNPEPQQYLVKGKKSAMNLKQANIKLDINQNPIVTVQTTPANSCLAAPVAQGYASYSNGYFRLTCTPQQAGEITFTINYKDKDDNNFTDDFKITVKADTGVKPIVAVSKTGVTTCATASSSSQACNSRNGLSQDGQLKKGESVTYTVHTSGSDTCVHDSSHNKYWEQKTNDGSLRDVKWTHAWYNLNGAQNRGNVGKKTTTPAAVCHSSLNGDCTTLAYINKLNTLNYCGKNTWRLPTFFELFNLLDFSKASTARTSSNLGMPAVFTYNLKQDSNGANQNTLYTSANRPSGSMQNNVINIDTHKTGAFYMRSNNFPAAIRAISD